MPRRGERTSERLVSQSQEPGTRELKRRPQRAAAARGNATNSAAPSSDSELTGTGSDGEGPMQYKGKATKAAQLVGGDDIDSDQPVKKTRLSLARAVTTIPEVEDDDSDGTSLTDVAEDSDGQELDAVIDHLSALEKADAEAKNVPLEETPSFLQIPEDLTPRASPSPAKRGGKQQRGGRGSNLLRGRLPGTPKKGNTRAGSQVRQSPAVLGANGILDRLPGRRRAHHADIDVEVDLRRQLELRVGYRALAKALKPVLAELAARTLRDLEADEELHKQCPEYQQVMDDLDERLKSRLAYINAEHDLEEQRLHRIQKAQGELMHQAAEHAVEHSQDTAMLMVQFNFMHTLRNIDQANRVEARRLGSTAPRIKSYQVQYSAPHNIPRHSLYVSELRHMTDTAFHWDKFEDRVELALAQRKFDPDSFQLLYDNDALTKEEREEIEEATGLLNLLFAAASEVENPRPPLAPPAPIPNSAAVGLNALADAISMLKPTDVPESLQPDVSATIPAGVQESPQQAARQSVESKPATPPSNITKSPPITPRTHPFKPSIASIMNAEPSKETDKPPAASTPTQADSIPSSDERSRRASIASGTKTIIKKSVAVELLNPPRPHPPLPEDVAAKAASVPALGHDVPESIEAQHSGAPNPAPLAAPQMQLSQGDGTRSLPPIQSQLPPHLQTHLVRPSEQSSHTLVQPHLPHSFYPYPQHSQQPSHEQMNNQGPQIQMTFEPPRRVRKRPGPRAIFTKQTLPDIPGAGQGWSPFANAMGPPTYIPKYVKENELVRRGSDSGVLSEVIGQPYQTEQQHFTPGDGLAAHHSRESSGAHDGRPGYGHNGSGSTEGHNYRPGEIVRSEQAPGGTHLPPPGSQPWNQKLYYNAQTHYGPSPTISHAVPLNVPTPSRAETTPPASTVRPSPEQHQSSNAPSERPGVPQYRPGNAQSWERPAPDGTASLPYPGPPPYHFHQREPASTEPSEMRRRSSITLPRLALQQPPPVSQAHHSYQYPPPPGDHNRQHSFHQRSNSMNSAPDREARRPFPSMESERQSDTRPISPTGRQSSQVPLLTPTAQPLPSYLAGPPPQHRRSVGSAEALRPVAQSSPGFIQRPYEPPSSRPSLPRDSSSFTSVIQINKPDEPTRPVLLNGQAIATTDVNTPKKATPRSTPATTTQPVTTTQSFKGQRPKHNEWRNWSTARPPPSAGATDNGVVSVPTMLHSTNGSTVQPSTRNRKKRAKSSQAQGEGEHANGSQAQQPGEVPTQQAPEQPPAPVAPQYGVPRKEWRFESVNKKFEGAGRGPEK